MVVSVISDDDEKEPDKQYVITAAIIAVNTIHTPSSVFEFTSPCHTG